MNTNDVKISIVMPLYNSERYLVEALDSVLKQTFQDFELLCVNDASEDHTIDILTKYQSMDSRIIILQNAERQGAAISRNKGMSIAQGKYLVFLDGDDIFDEEMLRLEYEYAECYDLDVVVCEYMHVSSDSIYQKRYHDSLKNYYGEIFRVCEQKVGICCELGMAPWNKLYKKDFIYAYHLQFQDLACCNDVYFVSMTYLLASRIGVLNDNRVMVYARDHFETSRISINRDPMCSFWAMQRLGQELVKRDLLQELSEYYYCEALIVLLAPFTGRKTVVSEETLRSYYDFLRTDGINNILTVGVKTSERKEIYRIALEQIKKMSYEEVKDFNLFVALLKSEHTEKIMEDIIREGMGKGKQVILWGAGRHGKVFVDFLERNNLMISGIVDLDANKVGNKLERYRIADPFDVLCEGDMLLFTSDEVYEEMRYRLNSEYCLVNVYALSGARGVYD